MTSQKCIACHKKFYKKESSLLCDDCYEKYKANMQGEKEPGKCPVCGGSVIFAQYYDKAFYAGEQPCSDKCKRIARLVKNRMEKENERDVSEAVQHGMH